MWLQNVDRVGNLMRRVESGHFNDIIVDVATSSESSFLRITAGGENKVLIFIPLNSLSAMTVSFAIDFPPRNRSTRFSAVSVLTRLITKAKFWQIFSYSKQAKSCFLTF